jgi:hypothetical protein
VASQKAKKRARKRRNPETAPRAVTSTRRDDRAERASVAERDHRRGRRQLGREGERPPSPFGGLPVSEFAILVGFVGALVGIIGSSSTALIVGIIVCGFGVVEVTAREHFSGYRSHTALLAAIPAVALEALVVAIFGEPKQRLKLLIVVVPVFAVLFWLLRKRFLRARQARVARPRAPTGAGGAQTG